MVAQDDDDDLICAVSAYLVSNRQLFKNGTRAEAIPHATALYSAHVSRAAFSRKAR
jgi:hypothetical protein